MRYIIRYNDKESIRLKILPRKWRDEIIQQIQKSANMTPTH